MSVSFDSLLQNRRAWLIAAALWLLPAVIFPTQQWAQLRDTPKAMSWIAAFLYQAPSWTLLVPCSVVLMHFVKRYPLERTNPARIAIHVALSALFGVMFLLVAVPVRHAMHPTPVRWTIFGDSFFKSAPQFIILGVAAYWLIVLVSSLMETRERLAAVVERNNKHDETAKQPSDSAESWRITFATAGGRAVVAISDIRWMEPAPGGARAHLSEREVLVRHSLAELESKLTPHGFLRLHRSVLANVNAIREVRGAPSRDGIVVLESGDELPISRRRRAELDARLAPQPA